MASTSSIVYLRPRAAAGAGNGVTGSVSFFAARSSTGIYSSFAIGKSNTRNRKVIRPVGVPIADSSTGMLNAQWEQYFAYIEKTFLNMLNGPTLPDVSNFVTVGQATNIAVEAAQQFLSQQVNSNAQTAQATLEVVKAAALPGATQIPPPKLYSEFVPSGGGFDSSGGE